MGKWGFSRRKKLTKTWPKDAHGDPIPPVLLTHIGGSPTDGAVILSMLEAYDIHTLCQYPNNGQFGQMMVGFAGGGVDIYVPETQFSEAKEILNAEIVPDGETEQDDT